MMRASPNRRLLLTTAAILPLAACGNLPALVTSARTAMGKIAATIAIDLPSASNVYAIAKGIGLVALVTLTVTDPAAAAIITGAIAAAEPVLAQLQASSTAISAADAASTLLTSANTILLAAAPSITAVNNAAKSP